MEKIEPKLQWVEVSATNDSVTLMMCLGEVTLVKEQVYNHHGDITHTNLTSVQSQDIDLGIRLCIRRGE